MSAYPNFLAGQRVTAALLNRGKPQYAINSGGAQTNATTTLANATDLSFAAEANSIYFVQLRLAYDAPTATDIKIAWSVPAAATMARNVIGQAAGTTTNIDTNAILIRRGAATQQTVGGPNAVSSAFSTYFEDVWLITSSAGTVQLQFAAAAAGTATLQGDSIIVYTQMAGPS